MVIWTQYLNSFSPSAQGDNYWSFRNGVKEPGYPRSVSKDFGGLSGKITAALSFPATKKAPEAVYFFKEGEASDHDSNKKKNTLLQAQLIFTYGTCSSLISF